MLVDGKRTEDRQSVQAEDAKGGFVRQDAATCRLCALSAYAKRVIALPGVRETVSIDPVKQGYHSIKSLNPNGIVPLGPELSALGL